MRTYDRIQFSVEDLDDFDSDSIDALQKKIQRQNVAISDKERSGSSVTTYLRPYKVILNGLYNKILELRTERVKPNA